MNSQSASPGGGAKGDDAWWHAVYEGPGDTVPDTPHARTGAGTVDDWFDTVQGVIGEPAAEAEGDAGTPAAVDEGAGAQAGTVDEWFDSVAGVIGAPADEGRPAVPAQPSGDHAAGAGGGAGTVDEWFDSVAGVIAAPAEAAQAAELPDDAGPGGEGEGTLPAADPAGAADEERVSAEAAPSAAMPDDETVIGSDEKRASADEAEPAAAPGAEAFPGPGRPDSGPPEPPSATEAPDWPVVDGADQDDALQDAAAQEAADVTRTDVTRTDETRTDETRTDETRTAVERTLSDFPQPVPYVGDRPPTYDAEPSALPAADPDRLAELVPDTVVEGARYGDLTLRAASVRGDSARYRGEPRRDALLVARVGAGADGVLLAAVASAPRGIPTPPAATWEACRQLVAALGRSRAELLTDLREGARDGLRFGLQRLTVRAAQQLRPPSPQASPVSGGDSGGDDDAAASEQEEREPGSEQNGGSLHCLLVPLDPAVGRRVGFGVGPGGLFLLRSDHWVDAYAARLLHDSGEPHRPGRTAGPDRPEGPDRPAAGFGFRLVTAIRGDILLLAGAGFAEPLRHEEAVARFLAAHWSRPQPPATVDFLRQLQVRAKGYADDRTAAVLWTG